MALVLRAYEAAAKQQACFQSRSLGMAISTGFTVLALSKYAIVLLRINNFKGLNKP
jgi:hypothetical protein